MDRAIYDRMAEIDRDHWWFSARRKIIDRLIRDQVPLPAGAQTYPSRPVRIVVPQTPGGGFGESKSVRIRQIIDQGRNLYFLLAALRKRDRMRA